MNKKLSVVTVCSNAISKEFYLKELIESVWDVADEIVIVNGDNNYDDETGRLIQKEFHKVGDIFALEDKIKLYHNPWELRMGCMMPRIQKSIAISHATMDYVLLLDADEVIHEKDHDKIRKALELDHFAYATRTLHFWRDFDYLKKTGTGSSWYDLRTRLFKNGYGIQDSHDGYNGYDCGLVWYNYAEKEEDRTYKPLSEHPDCKATSIEIYHYGHCRGKETYINKKNQIEQSYHPDWDDLKEWEWDMSETVPFEGTHPKVMKERIERFNNETISN